MTDSDRSPFRRFPWVQLAFCLACLAMTAWTWMLWSYAWDYDVSALWLNGADAAIFESRHPGTVIIPVFCERFRSKR